MTGPQLGPARAFDLAHRDLAAIAVRLEPMRDAGWWPAQPDRDRPTPHRPADAHPDYVAGSTWDCGQGDERVRQGFARLVCHLQRAEGMVTETHHKVRFMLAGADPADIVRAFEAVGDIWERLYQPTALLDAQAGVKRTEARVTALQGQWLKWVDSDPRRAAWLLADLGGRRGNERGTAFDHLRHAMFEAQRVIPIVGTGKPPATCTQCRRLGSIGQARIGGVCYACDKRNQRAGVPRRTTVAVKQRRATLRAAKRAVS